MNRNTCYHKDTNMRSALVVLISLTTMLAGCVGDAPSNIDEPVEMALPTAQQFPAWEGVDHTNVSRSGASFGNTSYLAYFSAPWCAHCESTLDAYDRVVLSDLMVVFSRDARERYGNMSEWHNNTEQNLNRTVDRPFVLHPDLAMEVEAASIPHAVFINAQGYAFHVEIGKQSNLTYVQNVWNLTQSAVFDELSGWNHRVQA